MGRVAEIALDQELMEAPTNVAALTVHTLSSCVADLSGMDKDVIARELDQLIEAHAALEGIILAHVVRQAAQ